MAENTQAVRSLSLSDFADMGKLRDALMRSLNPILEDPRVGRGGIIEVRFYAGKEERILHKLDRKPLGWRITDLKQCTRIWRSAEPDDQALYLTSENDAIADVEVF